MLEPGGRNNRPRVSRDMAQSRARIAGGMTTAVQGGPTQHRLRAAVRPTHPQLRGRAAAPSTDTLTVFISPTPGSQRALCGESSLVDGHHGRAWLAQTDRSGGG